MPTTIDYTGRRFGRLTVIEFVMSRYVGNQSKRIWRCRCDCGSITELPAGALTQSNTRSCGCLTRDTNTTHGQSDDPVYKVWHAMIERCRNSNHTEYRDYGGRGITICERWRNSFEAFLADMGSRPTGKSLDRYPNNDGNYEPGNCRWATPTEQANNRRNNRIIEHAGERLTVAEWAARLGCSKQCLLHRLKAGWSVERAITTTPDRSASFKASRLLLQKQ